MGGIKSFNQIEILSEPINPKHIVTKEYFENNMPIASGSGLYKVFEIIGDDSTTEYNFIHNFNTMNVFHYIYNETTGSDVIFNFKRLNKNEVIISSDMPLGFNNNYTLVVLGHREEKIDYKIWGVKIDTLNSNPDASVVFTDDCLISGPPSDFGERPCLLKNGVVQYYLNPNDFTKKEDGSSADLTGGDGDVMIEIPRLAYLIRYVGNDLHIKVTDHQNAKELDPDFCYYGHTRDTEGDLDDIYIGAYLGQTVSNKLRSISGVLPSDTKTIGTFRTEAKANGSGYDQISFYPLTLLQCMYLVKYRNLNTQTVLGRGYVDANTAYIKTGGTDGKGMYYGETTGKLQMKFAGLEDFWGNKVFWIDGYVTNANREVLTAFKDFSDAGTGYTNRGYSAAANIDGYCKKVIGNKECAFITQDSAGSATTYYCDHNYRRASCVAFFGGVLSGADFAGAFQLSAYDAASYSYANRGARLMFRPTS